MTTLPSLAALYPRADPITELPILILFPHSRCNCRCLMCDIWRSTSRDELTPEELDTWLEEWRALGVRRVVLSGGEALLHSRLWELCARLGGAGIGVTLLSTGLLLRRHARALVQHCDDVVVSLDGPEEQHDAIRNVPRAYARLADGVAALREAAAEPGPRPPRAPFAAHAGPGQISISGRCTIQRSNFRQLRGTVRAARAIGLDRISFLAADVDSEAFNRPGGWAGPRAAEVALTAEELPALAAELAALEAEHAEDFASGFIAESPAKLQRRIYQHFAALAGQGDFSPPACNAPWVSSVVEADGTVRPCFFQPPLGNLREAGSLAALLNSPAAIAWRQGLDTARDAICRRCVCSLNLRQPDLGPP